MSNTYSEEDDDFEPEDTIKRSRQPNGIDRRDSDRVDLLVTHTNFSRPFSLRDLAIIAQTVVASADASADFILLQQCYWFTRTLVGITIERYHPQPVGGVSTITSVEDWCLGFQKTCRAHGLLVCQRGAKGRGVFTLTHFSRVVCLLGDGQISSSLGLQDAEC